MTDLHIIFAKNTLRVKDVDPTTVMEFRAALTDPEITTYTMRGAARDVIFNLCNVNVLEVIKDVQ